jgi:GTP-binding protein
MEITRNDLRNIAIIAHVDHGKTTLVDGMLRQSGIFRANAQVAERVMDSNDLERERGITILAKNTGVVYEGVKINIVDTPGHADFGGEVERILSTVDGVLLLVDAAEGPMAQTKYVLKKALAQHLTPIVVINKIDRSDARIETVVDKVLDLFIELEANDAQLDFPLVYAIARNGTAKLSLGDEDKDLRPLFDMILDQIPAPTGDPDAPLQVLASTLDYDDYLGRIIIGRVTRGTLHVGQTVGVAKHDGRLITAKVQKLFQFMGLARQEVDEAKMGDIVAISGIEDIALGETVVDPENPEPLPFTLVDEPTVTMEFAINDSPFSGQEGTYVTSRHLRDRLYREARGDVSLKVTDTESTDTFKVAGRGELHLGILIETMRREGYEFQVSKPDVIYREVDGEKHEPMEYLTVDIPEEYLGIVMERIGGRKGDLANMVMQGNHQVHLEFDIAARALLGLRSELLTDTRGFAVMNHSFNGYGPYKGDLPGRGHGVLVAWEEGETTAYALLNAEERGVLFIGPGEHVYEGMIIGRTQRPSDLDVNVCKKKHLTNLRSSSSDETVHLTPPEQMSLDRGLEFIESDELIEVTPKSIRLRKKELDHSERMKASVARTRGA